MSDFEETETAETVAEVNTSRNVDSMSHGATASGNSGSNDVITSSMMMKTSKQAHVRDPDSRDNVSPKLGSSKDDQTGDLTDEELVNLPCVKNLFNKFWDEKMKEMNKGQNSKNSQEFIKSPSDTTIYVPALAKSPPQNLVTVMNVLDKNGSNQAKGRSSHELHEPSEPPLQIHTDVDNMVSNFVDSVRIEQRQGELDLQEKERRLSSKGNVGQKSGTGRGQE